MEVPHTGWALWRSLTLAGAGGADRVPDDQSGATTVASQRSGYCPQVVVGAAAAEVEVRRFIVVSSSPRLVGDTVVHLGL